jgi:hypothetical protein
MDIPLNAENLPHKKMVELRARWSPSKIGDNYPSSA